MWVECAVGKWSRRLGCRLVCLRGDARIGAMWRMDSIRLV